VDSAVSKLDLTFIRWKGMFRAAVTDIYSVYKIRKAAI